MPWKKKGCAQQELSATFPLLHQDVLIALDDVFINPEPWFNHDASESEPVNDYNTNIMGRFECRNRKCHSAGWGSKKIAIRIRGFRDNGYDAVVFKQRCRTCEKLGVMRIDENSYVERVAYRLKKWAGVYMETHEYHNGVQQGPPHESDLCEGCKAGYCPMR
ncbi:zinc-binding domain-containing protein [Staphylotrichum tortipilum]|uniref:Zinc-binding domain-containing protein n=1 Tax=Staphylotrichum tortipilum TaxID=2831512 RepID=A0AAN6MNP4_9PEZI|nr:zinc-binding domain-containing protein [Staphylotrichum longicolle]